MARRFITRPTSSFSHDARCTCCVDDTRKDHKSVSDDGFKNWLELIDLYGGHSPVPIFQNEKGGRSKAIDIAGIKGRFDNVKDVYAGNLEDPGCRRRVRQAIDFHASHLEHIGEYCRRRGSGPGRDSRPAQRNAPTSRSRNFFEIYGRHMPLDRTGAPPQSVSPRSRRVPALSGRGAPSPHGDPAERLGHRMPCSVSWTTRTSRRAYGRFGRGDFERLWKRSGMRTCTQNSSA